MVVTNATLPLSVDQHIDMISVSIQYCTSNLTVHTLVLILLCIACCNFLYKLLNPNPSKNVYLLDFSCHKAQSSQQLSKQLFIEKLSLYAKDYDVRAETIDFTQKILERSGLGECTYTPNSILMEPPTTCLNEAIRDAEAVLFEIVDQVLVKTGIKAEEIGILVVNCGLFSSVPSFCAMIVNKFKLRDDVATYNLSGMGCSASLAAVGLVQHLLQVHEDTYALVVSIENVTAQSFYVGNHRPMVPVNCLFRVGGAAMILSNHASDRHTSKYQLTHVVRTNTAMSDPSYKCIFQEEDAEGKRGVTISSDLLICAIKTIEANLLTLGPLILPLSEQVSFILKRLSRKLRRAKVNRLIIPKFNQVIDHFFPHVGGKPVLDSLQSKLKFTDVDMEAARMTLYRFGNTSSSSIWYELAYAEAKGRIRKGDRVWQFAFGSGFKCNSVIWRALKNVKYEKLNPWSDEIDQFPVDVDDIGPLVMETLYK